MKLTNILNNYNLMVIFQTCASNTDGSVSSVVSWSKSRPLPLLRTLSGEPIQLYRYA